MIGPAPLDITICQGDDFQLPFQLFDQDNQPVGLNGAAITAKVRNDVDDVAPILVLSGAVTGGDTGEGLISATGAQTGAVVLPASPQKKRPLTKYLWDAHVTFSDGVTVRIFEGFCFFDPTASK